MVFFEEVFVAGLLDLFGGVEQGEVKGMGAVVGGDEAVMGELDVEVETDEVMFPVFGAEFFEVGVEFFDLAVKKGDAGLATLFVFVFPVFDAFAQDGHGLARHKIELFGDFDLFIAEQELAFGFGFAAVAEVAKQAGQ